MKVEFLNKKYINKIKIKKCEEQKHFRMKIKQIKKKFITKYN